MFLDSWIFTFHLRNRNLFYRLLISSTKLIHLISTAIQLGSAQLSLAWHSWTRLSSVGVNMIDCNPTRIHTFMLLLFICSRVNFMLMCHSHAVLIGAIIFLCTYYHVSNESDKRHFLKTIYFSNAQSVPQSPSLQTALMESSIISLLHDFHHQTTWSVMRGVLLNARWLWCVVRNCCHDEWVGCC